MSPAEELGWETATRFKLALRDVQTCMITKQYTALTCTCV